MGATSPQAAGKIHTDFEKVLSAPRPSPMKTLSPTKVSRGKRSWQDARRRKDYIVKDGDVMNFLFNVWLFLLSHAIPVNRMKMENLPKSTPLRGFLFSSAPAHYMKAAEI